MKIKMWDTNYQSHAQNNNYYGLALALSILAIPLSTVAETTFC